MSEKIMLIDGHSILFRAFYAMPLTMTGADGVHTNAVYGFLMILRKVLEDEKPDYLAVAFDLPAPTFRHEKYEAYKGNRAPAPPEFHEQVPLMKEVLKKMDIPYLEKEGWEADDILGTLARISEEHGLLVALVSGDRDLLQIATKKTRVIIPKTKAGVTTYEQYDEDGVKSAMGVTPREFIDMKALMGDSSDNIPGLPGVGPKTASQMIQTFGSIENAHAHEEEITPNKARTAMKEHYDLAVLSKDLATIRTNAPLEADFDAFRLNDIYTKDAYEEYKRLGFKSLLSFFPKADAPENENRFIFVTELSEAEDIFSEACKSVLCGICVMTEDGEVRAAGLSFSDKTWVIPAQGFLTPAYLAEKTAGVIRSAKTSAICGAKETIKCLGIENDGRIFDNIIAAYLINPLKSDWDYDDIASAYLEETVKSRDEFLGKKSGTGTQSRKAGKNPKAAKAGSGSDDANADGGISEAFSLCCGYQAETAFRSYKPLSEKLAEEGMTDLFRKIEMPLVYTLASMEKDGILASREELKKYGDSLSSHIDGLTAEIYKEAGEEFNINSPKQLAQILFEKMHFEGGKKTKTGYSTAADVLEKMAPDHKIVADILEYRTYAKLKSTYADGLTAYIEEDGRIHTTFNQTIAATGRLSSTEPNLQNIPMREDLGRQIRKCFYPAPGCVFVDADYSQIELRILAHMSGDEKLIEAYREARDIHRMTASQVFHVPFDEVTDEMRRNAKAVNFGIVYGISSFGLSQGLSISTKEAADYIKNYFETYPKIKDFLDGLVASAKEKGYAVSLFGRRRPVPELSSSNFMQRNFGERVAMNSPIQGTAADIMKIAMNHVCERLSREGLKARLILQIHDELLVEAPEGESEKVAAILTEEMKDAADLKVSLETDCHIGTDWYEAK